MLKDLESSSRHEDHLKKIKKKWMDQSKKYKETIEHMKEYQEETYQKKNKELVKRLKKKEQILLTALKNNQKSRMKERQKMFEALMQKEKQSRQNVQNFLIKQEKERQKLQIDNNGKSNYIYILYIINYDFF
jgi:glutamine synthetase adenylyltransferase